MAELPPSRFFDLPPKALSARVKLNLTVDDVRRALGDSTSPETHTHAGGSVQSPRVCVSPGLSNTPYSPVEKGQLLELLIRPASVRLRVRPARAKGEFDQFDPAPKHRTKRGRIKEFSAKSRLGLQLLAADLQEVVCKPDMMLTLTYPAEWRSVTTDWACRCEASEGCSDVPCVCDFVPSGKVCKRHLDLFQKRLTRTLKLSGVSEWGALWFLEFQKRGAPHFHMMLFGVGLADIVLSELRSWVSSAWADIVGHTDPTEFAKHLKAGTRTERCKKPHFGYALKYAAKLEQKDVPPEFADIGRFWGCWNSPLKSPVLRSFYTSNRTLSRIAEWCEHHFERYSPLFGQKVCGALDTATQNAAFSFTLFGPACSRFFTSYGLPKSQNAISSQNAIAA